MLRIYGVIECFAYLQYSETFCCPATKRQDDYQLTIQLMIGRHLVSPVDSKLT